MNFCIFGLTVSLLWRMSQNIKIFCQAQLKPLGACLRVFVKLPVSRQNMSWKLQKINIVVTCWLPEVKSFFVKGQKYNKNIQIPEKQCSCLSLTSYNLSYVVLLPPNGCLVNFSFVIWGLAAVLWSSSKKGPGRNFVLQIIRIIF